MELRPFQRRFIRRALSPEIDTAAISLPRAGGKTFLCAHIVAKALTPSDPSYESGREIVLISGSLQQARFAYKFVKAALEPLGIYRWNSSTTAVGALDKSSGTQLRCLSSNPKTILGLVGTAIAVLDEPGAYEVVGGQDLWDAVLTSQGKPGSRMRILLAGTRAPARPGSWWLALLDRGSVGTTYIQQLKGDLSKWDSWAEIKRVNPLVSVSADFRRKLLEERDEARRDDRAKARFLSYRLNLESTDETSMLLSVPEWRRCEGRALRPGGARPVVGVDLGGGRSWSAATAVFPGGRVESFALTSGIPPIMDQERRDVAPRGTYARLVAEGALLIDRDRHIPRASLMVDEILRRWPGLRFVVCDRFRLHDLLDAFGGRATVVPRVTRWSESAADIRAVRQLALDGNLSVEPRSRALMRIALAAAVVQHDSSGNSRLVKKGSNSTGRDDPAHALTLACGALSRLREATPPVLRIVRRAG